MTVSNARFAQLKQIIVASTNDTDWFDPENWTDYVDDGTLTEEELQWLNQNCRIVLSLVRNSAG